MGKIVGICLLVACRFFVFAQEVDSNSLSIGKLEIDERDTWKADPVKLYNPVVSGIASMVVPGAGQVYTGHYVKAGFFPVLEGIFLSMAVFWRNNASVYDLNSEYYKEWEAFDSTAYGKANYREQALLSRQNAIEARFSQYNFTAWAIGAHVFNLLDALQSSNVFRNTDVRNPKTAGLLAAVPGLGLGQLYNGSFSKAGMVMMTQVSLGMMAYNSHRLMNRAALNYKRLSDPKADSLTLLLKDQYSNTWYGNLQRSFTGRNMYLWYSIFFYFYSIFDSVVDANLHDYPEKMKIAPDLVFGKESVYFSLTTTVPLPKTAQ
jgi:hypothetical protein